LLVSLLCQLKFKGSFLRKLKWVKSSANHWVLASDCGSEQSFVCLICQHLLFSYFCSYSSLPNYRESSRKISKAVCDVAPIILVQYIIRRRTPHFKETRGALTLPIGGAGAFAAQITKICRFFYLHHTSPVSGAKIAAPMELAQGKEHEKIGEAGKLFRRTSPIGP
jgi:hypothetical protein